ncbi:ubiquitin carboxyl-terminal hydrolase 26 [Microcebus murinus]|uniref:ubiquitin carboxyl-terminal hydrolase 26 n=1 Tax=Microcebus murinus TaxID=30608 RepID=UPI000642A8E2|nr:ubiquitin carboxyl-terminal hydrolase 26 isoform X2 [Microcebus murinus]XP_012620220.1 ubiquitin carboxyl-terminal hydrolase 26 isoform X2 [Microcebus murinus]
MSTLFVHGYVQIWSMKTGMSKSKEAFIETVKGKKKVQLVLYFNTGELKTFQLSNNIKNVVLRSYGEKQNHLHLTFQNNNFLFIERLSSKDAEQLKRLLDKVHGNKSQPCGRPHKHKGVFASTITQEEIHQTSFQKVNNKSRGGSYETGKGSETPALQEIPLFTSKSSMPICKRLLENLHRKRKGMILSSSEMNEKFLKESSLGKKKSKMNPLKYVSHNPEKQFELKELKEKKKLEFESLFMTNSTGNPYLDSTGLQTLAEKVFLAFLLEPDYNEYGLEWEELRMSLDLHPDNKLWQGLPNLGNTCYMNATLQCLFAIPSFVDDLLNQDFPWGKMPLGALSMCLAQLFILKDIYNIKIKEKLLVNIKKAISAVAEIFSGNVQNDAHEFLGHCLDQLKENSGKINRILKTKSESEEENSPQQVCAGDAATEVLVCPVISNFEFELMRSIVCKACGQVVLKTELSNYLSVNLPQGPKALPLSIQSTFDLFFQAEELEYNCEKCKHKTSLAVHKFSRLPRVLIVHLKRYRFNEFWSLRKDDQEVIISKYLNLSSHCNESTKPPLPPSEKARIRDFQVLKFFQNLNSGTISSLRHSIKLTLESKNSLAVHIRSDKESEPQKYQRVFKGTSREQQQKDLGKNSKLNTTQSELLNTGDEALIEKELLVGSMMYLEDTSLSLIHRDGGKFTSSTDKCVAKVHHQQVPENPKLKKYKKTRMCVAFDKVTKPTKNFYQNEKIRIPKGFREVAEQTHQCNGMRICEEASQQALPQSFPKPGAKGHTKNGRGPMKLNLQGDNVKNQGALGSEKNSGNKDIFNKKTESKAKEPKRNAYKEDLPTYRLIGIVSHIGTTPKSGHYISDAYDFERQAWFTYNDTQVSNIQEALMQEERLCTGYIFFYMHNEIFEELLKRAESSQLHSGEAGKTPQE